MHAPWRSAGLTSNALLAVKCAHGIAPERVRESLERLLDVCPWPAARLRRRWPWGKLHWAAGRRGTLAPPPVRYRALATSADLDRELEVELNTTLDPRRGPLLRILIGDVGDGPRARGVLVLTWFHPLMDPRGAQTLLASLDALDRDARCEGPSAMPPPADRRPLAERGRIARRSLAYMQTLAPTPPVSPGTGLVAPGRHRFRRERFVDRDSGARGKRFTREISWRVAVVGRAMAELWSRRGLPDTPFLLPISVDLRPRGEPGPIFGNHLAFHFARFRPSETADVPALARMLRTQMADAVRDGQVEANQVAMEFLHHRPVARMMRPLPWTRGGETFSFNCADIGEMSPSLDRIFGAAVLDACHVPAVLPRPGIGVFFNRCASGTNLVVSWVEGAVSEGEVSRIMEVVREEMGWVRAP